MAIEELIAIVKAPPQPLEVGPLEQWQLLEKQAKLALPSDLRELAVRFGSGKFVPPGLIVFNPFASHYLDRVAAAAAIWRSLKEGEGKREVPYEIFPTVPGLLPWGSDENGCGLFWLTKGTPEKWPVVVRPHDTAEYSQFDMPLTTFLARAFRREIDSTIWPTSFFKKRRRVVFQPMNFPFVKPPTLRSILDIYKENGDRAGFWIQHGNWLGGNEVWHVKEIDGQAVGPIKETPALAAAIVTADVFDNGKKAVADHQFRDPTANAYQRVDPPN